MKGALETALDPCSSFCRPLPQTRQSPRRATRVGAGLQDRLLESDYFVRSKELWEIVQSKVPVIRSEDHFGRQILQQLSSSVKAEASNLQSRLPRDVEVPDWLAASGRELEALLLALQAQADSILSQQDLKDVLQRIDEAKSYVTSAQWQQAQQVLRELYTTTGSPASRSEPHFGTHAAQRFWDQTSTGLLANQDFSSYQEAFKALAQQAGQQINQLVQQLSLGLSHTFSDLSNVPASLRPTTGILGEILLGENSWKSVAAISAGMVLVFALSVRSTSGLEGEEPLPPLLYDVDEVGAYWAQRPIAVARRSVVVAFEGLRWAAGLGFDKLQGRVKQNASKRAVALRQAFERLGPAYIKVAQAVSTRVDLLDPDYLVEIERLQDNVPPFPTKLAEDIMQRAFGQPSSRIFSRLSREPFAAASLGQVYRGKLQSQYGGGEVAVKIQRPGVLPSVALDLFLMRWIAVYLDEMFKTHWAGIIEEWAGRFFHELDYKREARNAIIFKEQMRRLDGITVPDVYLDLCSREVLTTAWVDGEKLNESNASDVKQLCTTLLNCYLIQLLETGFLHADPHPGNLLRTPDGRICILDYGLMTQISKDRSLALVEYMAHLTTQDYVSIPGDLYKLGFIPDGAPDPLTSGLVEPLGEILYQLSRGGGAKAINIEEVIGQIEDLTKKYPFEIPSYFALILRAFSVIEGIALRADPKYAIVQECFPYVSRRLFTDNSPRVRAALQQMLYGNKRRLDIGRLKRMASGFGDFTVQRLPSGPEAEQDGKFLDETAKEALRTLFRPEGSLIQELFVEEAVAATDAIGREVASQLAQGIMGSLPAVATLSFIEALGPLRPFVLPVATLPELLSRFAPSIAPTEEDEEALSTARSIFSIFQSQPGAPTNQNGLQQLAQLAQELQPLLPELLPGAAITGELFLRSLVRRVALRIAEEAQRPPNAREEYVRQQQGEAKPQNSSSWLQDAIGASLLQILMPRGFPSGYPSPGIFSSRASRPNDVA